MTLAIANHELAKEHFPGVFPDVEEPMEEPLRCAHGPGDPIFICASDIGHRGRHTFHSPVETEDGLANRACPRGRIGPIAA